jgi:hypothetical protein
MIRPLARRIGPKRDAFGPRRQPSVEPKPAAAYNTTLTRPPVRRHP